MPNLILESTAAGIELPADFFQVAKDVYQEDPYWIPEDENKIRQHFFSADNPYFEKCHATVLIHGTDARLVGFYNPELEIEGERAVYFGFWETKNNVSINRELFSKLELWAQRIDSKADAPLKVYGPINFSTYQNNRLRMDEFEDGSFIDEPHNPSYYSDILEQLAFEKKYSYITAINKDVDKLIQQITPSFTKLKKSVEGLFSFERLTSEVWLDSLETLYPLVDAIFSQNFAYSPISWETFKVQCGKSFSKKLCPETSVLVRDSEGEIAGFFITYPDYSSLVNQSAVNVIEPMSVSGINYEKHYQQLKSPRLLLAKTCGIAPKYRSSGLFPLMSMQLTLWAESLYEHISGAMIREDNASESFYKSLIKSGNEDFVFHNYALFTKPIIRKYSDSRGVSYD